MEFGTLIASVLTGLIAAIATICNSRMQNDKTQAILRVNLEHYRESTDSKIESLSARVEKHNGLVERMVKQEMNTEAQWKRIDELRDSIQSIEERLT